MTRSPHLVIDDRDSNKPRISWFFPEEDDFGSSVGEKTYTESDLKACDAEDVDCAIAFLAVATRKDDRRQKDYQGFYWESHAAAQSALRVIKAAIAAGADRPLPDWAQQALAAGWKAPKGWKP